MKSREYFGASAATAQSPGPITIEILHRTDFAGYEIFTQVSYQYGGLISPAHEKSTLLISRSGSAQGQHLVDDEFAATLRRDLSPPKNSFALNSIGFAASIKHKRRIRP
jgi:hypothetical protein